MSGFIEVTTTTSSREEAYKISRNVIEKRLAACAQIIGPMTSIYWWNESIEESNEWFCIFKTRKELYKQLQRVIKNMHTYELPQILYFEVKGGFRAYLRWIDSSVTVKKGRQKKIEG